MTGRGTYKIQASNGGIYEVQANDDAQAQRMEKYINRQIAAGDPNLKQGKAPDRAIVRDPAVIPATEKPTSFVQGVGEGFLDVVNHGASWAESGLNLLGGAGDAINQFGADTFGMAPSVAAATEQQARDAAASPTRGSETGKFVGQMLGTAPTMVAGGAFRGGMAAGALLSDSDSLLGVGTDALVGGVGGKVADFGVRGAARLIAPQAAKLGDNVQLLMSEGIKALTPGQIARDSASGAARKAAAFEDRAISQPFVGDMIQADRTIAVDQLNRAVASKALKEIGETLPASVPTGHKSVAHTGDRLSAAYSDVLPRLKGTLDRTFERRIAALQSRADLPPEYAGKMADVMREAGNAFTAGTRNATGAAPGRFTGRTFRDASDRLDKLSAGWSASSDPYERQLGEFASQVREQLHALARRQNPADAARLRSIDRGYAMLVRLENAARGATNGVVSPNQLRTAVRTSDRSTRKRAVSRGEALLQPLSDAASQVMPSDIGDSGTSGRWAQSTLAGLARGAAQTVPYALARRDAQRAMAMGPTSRVIAGLIRAGAPVAAQAGAVAPAAVRGPPYE